ncbi:MAG: flagellar motor protein MotD [Gammaproteobacteria bacterium]|jgi:chemotaxis protein MotB
MARKKKHEEHENHERWLVSYADFITLLFAFFVVMYALSSINEGKYRVLSQSLIAAFHSAPRSLEPIQVGNVEASGPPMQSPVQNFPAPVQFKGLIEDAPDPRRDAMVRAEVADPDELAATEAAIQKMAQAIRTNLKSMIDDKVIIVKQHKLWIDIKINTDILFGSGSIRLSPVASHIIENVTHTLAPLPARIQVEGFTDNVPIVSREFPSNWELSAARAASVVRLMTQFGVNPDRMAAIGYGEYRPIAGNDTAEGRAQNRRVDLVVLAASKAMQVPVKPLPDALNTAANQAPEPAGGG